jgi:putative SOS response-associated peptidase YedK
MCGRYTLRVSAKELQEFFEILRMPEGFEYRASYNVPPTRYMPVVRLDAPGHRELTLMRWGLIPSWAKDIKTAGMLNNARADTVATKPLFRTAFKKRRCLIPADGFCEWLTEGKTKRPHLIHRQDNKPFGFAGIWETWHDPQGAPVESYAIITTDGGKLMAPIHDRQPVIVPPDNYDKWLNDAGKAPALLEQLTAKPGPYGDMEAFEVGKLVGNVKNDVPECVEPLA